MGNARILYDNFITSSSMITASSMATGYLSTAMKIGTGSVSITITGEYVGANDLEFVASIDTIAGGTEVGQSTFKWSDSGGVSWDATGTLTSSTATLLNNNVYVAWEHAADADFASGDTWYFKVRSPFGIGKLLDLDRDHRYRSQKIFAVNTMTIDIGTEQAVNALVIYDHNFSSDATVHLWGDDAATFDSATGSPQVDETITITSGKILHYLATSDRTKRYWRLRMQDLDNSDGYIEIGELYLGSYLELSRNFSNGYTRTYKILKDSNSTPYGIEWDRYYNTQTVFSIDFKNLTSTDVTNMKTLLDTISSRTNGTIKAFWFNVDSSDTEDFYLVKNDDVKVKHSRLSYFEIPLDLYEVMTSV